jgi:hypothetical protein
MEVGFRKSNLTLVLPNPLAAGAGQATHYVTTKGRISHVQLGLSDTGVGAGSTEVVINVNGVPVSNAGGIAIAGAAASKTAGYDVTQGTNNYPGGARVNKGDLITVDVISVPATTVPKQAVVILEITQIDV